MNEKWWANGGITFLQLSMFELKYTMPNLTQNVSHLVDTDSIAN